MLYNASDLSVYLWPLLKGDLRINLEGILSALFCRGPTDCCLDRLRRATLPLNNALGYKSRVADIVRRHYDSCISHTSRYKLDPGYA